MPEKSPEAAPVIFHSKSRKTPPPEPAPSLPPPAPPVAIPSAEQLSGMLNGLMGNMFENSNWWLWAALIIILLNPDLRKKLFGKGKEPES